MCILVLCKHPLMKQTRRDNGAIITHTIKKHDNKPCSYTVLIHRAQKPCTMNNMMGREAVFSLVDLLPHLMTVVPTFFNNSEVSTNMLDFR